MYYNFELFLISYKSFTSTHTLLTLSRLLPWWTEIIHVTAWHKLSTVTNVKMTGYCYSVTMSGSSQQTSQLGGLVA